MGEGTCGTLVASRLFETDSKFQIIDVLLTLTHYHVSRIYSGGHLFYKPVNLENFGCAYIWMGLYSDGFFWIGLYSDGQITYINCIYPKKSRESQISNKCHTHQNLIHLKTISLSVFPESGTCRGLTKKFSQNPKYFMKITTNCVIKSLKQNEHIIKNIVCNSRT